MLQNYSEIYWGGLTLRVEDHGNNCYHNSIIISSGKELWRGSPAEFEAIFESHQLLKDAAKQLVSAANVKDKCINVTDARELNNAILSATEALHRAD